MHISDALGTWRDLGARGLWTLHFSHQQMDPSRRKVFQSYFSVCISAMCYQSVEINLVHRLCTDFQYFSLYVKLVGFVQVWAADSGITPRSALATFRAPDKCRRNIFIPWEKYCYKCRRNTFVWREKYFHMIIIIEISPRIWETFSYSYELLSELTN